MNESSIFKPIPILNNQYETNEDGTIIRNTETHEIVPNNNYEITVEVTYPNSVPVTRTIRIHKIVASAYLGDCPPGYCISHIDGNHRINTYTNLEYIPNEALKKVYHAKSENPHYVVAIFGNSDAHWFETYNDCARFLAEKSGTTVKNKKYRLRIHRNYINGYRIQYLD